MEEDDISAIVVTNNKGNSLTSIVPPPDFSFPKEEINRIYTCFFNNTIPDPNELSDMHVNQLMNQFRGVANDFDQIRQKLRFQQLLF